MTTQSQIQPGSYVSFQNIKRWYIGQSPKGKAVLLVPKVQGEPSRPDQYVNLSDLKAWTEAAPAVECVRYFNVYTEGRAGSLLKTLQECDLNAVSSVRERIGIVQVKIVGQTVTADYLPMN